MYTIKLVPDYNSRINGKVEYKKEEFKKAA